MNETLRKNDRVQRKRDGRLGIVFATPRRGTFSVCVLWDNGCTNYRYVSREELQHAPPSAPPPPVREAKPPSIYRAVNEPEQHPEHPRPPESDQPKTYVITYLNQNGTFGVEKVPAKGMVHALSIFYIQTGHTAVISIICVL
jgi:hypothetical protein